MKYAAFLRGIGPGNPNMRNEKLIWLFEKLGFKSVRSIIASGNLVFESGIRDSQKLEEKVEKALPEYLGFNSTTIIRSKDEIDKLVLTNPFAKIFGSKTEKPNVTFFKDPPDFNRIPKSGRGFKAYGMESGAFCYTVNMIVIKTPEAMLTLEREFGKKITTRTWNTVLKVQKALDGGLPVKTRIVKSQQNSLHKL